MAMKPGGSPLAGGGARITANRQPARKSAMVSQIGGTNLGPSSGGSGMMNYGGTGGMPARVAAIKQGGASLGPSLGGGGMMTQPGFPSGGMNLGPSQPGGGMMNFNAMPGRRMGQQGRVMPGMRMGQQGMDPRMQQAMARMLMQRFGGGGAWGGPGNLGRPQAGGGMMSMY
jgi:hypothetical protein